MRELNKITLCSKAEVIRKEREVLFDWHVGDLILDLYEVKQIYSGGNMGLVYRVHHKDWNLDLAVKSPRPEYFQTPQHKENFARECQSWIDLGMHPNIVNCYYIRRLGGIPRIFAEYIEGGSLKDWIDNKKLYEGGEKIVLKRMLNVAIQLVWGLSYAHEKGLVHQDVKPANILMTEEGIVKVTDFGLARARAATGETKMRGAQQSILVSSGGMTPAYCSPEQAKKEKLSHKTDIWSWGLSVLEMFAGEVFWRSGQAALEVLEEQYLKMGPVKPDLPPMPEKMVDLLRKCFQPVPDDRPDNMSRIQSILLNIYKNITGTKYPRENPKAVALLAESLNNRAVSMLDLGEHHNAKKYLEEALKTDPIHPVVVYNQGLYLWRSGKITDIQLIQQLEHVHKTQAFSSYCKYLLGLAHIERGDAELAEDVLEKAFRSASGDFQIQKALTITRAGINKWGRCLRTFEQNEAAITSLAISNDGRLVLSGSGSASSYGDNMSRLWDIKEGTCIGKLQSGHKMYLSCVAISRDGNWGISGSWDHTLHLWNLTTKKRIRKFVGHNREVYSVTLSKSNRWALSASGDHTLRMWDITTGKCLKIYTGHAGGVKSVVISPCERWCLSGSDDKTLRLWDLLKGRCIQIFEGHTGPITSAAISPNGQWSLSGSKDETLRMWDLKTGKCVQIFKGHNGCVNSVSISPNSFMGLSGGEDSTLRLWELATGRCLRTFVGHTKNVTSVIFAPNGQLGLSGGWDGTIRLWRLMVGPPQQFIIVQPHNVSDLDTRIKSADNLLLEADQLLKEWQIDSALKSLVAIRKIPEYDRKPDVLSLWRTIGLYCCRRALRDSWIKTSLVGSKQGVRSAVFYPDSHRILSGGEEQDLRSWDLLNGNCLKVFSRHNSWVNSIYVSRNGHFALSGGEDQTLRLWELSNSQCVKTMHGHTRPINTVAISPNDRLGLSGGDDGTIRLWEIRSGTCLRTISEDKYNTVTSVAFSPDGRMCLSGNSKKRVCLWDLETGICLKSFEGHTDTILAVSISQDGRWALSGSKDKTLRLWDLTTKECVQILEGHEDWVSDVKFTPDSRWAFSGSHDNTLRIWELKNGRCRHILEGHKAPLSCIDLSQDSHWVLSGSWDKSIQIWELDWDYEFPGWMDWNQEALAYLETFLILHCPKGGKGVNRYCQPCWNEADFRNLLKELQYRGYGWLKPEGVLTKLKRMTISWQNDKISAKDM